MSADTAATIASTLQSASINRAPSARHDINPTSTASAKIPVLVSPPSTPSTASPEPKATLRPVPRRAALPPLPDLRFEQSYLASLKDAADVKAVCWITIRDQVFMPLVQGMLWTLLLAGWRHWNRASSFKGRGLGVKIRRWWWGVNGWKYPSEDKAERLGEYVQAQAGAGGD